jgi:hypothetical protein
MNNSWFYLAKHGKYARQYTLLRLALPEIIKDRFGCGGANAGRARVAMETGSVKDTWVISGLLSL